MFSLFEVSVVSCSKELAFRFEGEVRVVRAREVVRLCVMVELNWV